MHGTHRQSGFYTTILYSTPRMLITYTHAHTDLLTSYSVVEDVCLGGGGLVQSSSEELI